MHNEAFPPAYRVAVVERQVSPELADILNEELRAKRYLRQNGYLAFKIPSILVSADHLTHSKGQLFIGHNVTLQLRKLSSVYDNTWRAQRHLICIFKVMNGEIEAGTLRPSDVVSSEQWWTTLTRVCCIRN